MLAERGPGTSRPVLTDRKIRTMRRLILATTAIAVLAVPALAPALASADVQRTQEATLTSTVNGTYVHTYNVDITGDSFTGTGSVVSNGATIPETISGTINGKNISFNAAYTGSSYTWSSTGTTGTDSLHQQLTVSSQLTINDYKNHGAYVSSQGGGADAAHSDIGMPINSNN